MTLSFENIICVESLSKFLFEQYSNGFYRSQGYLKYEYFILFSTLVKHSYTILRGIHVDGPCTFTKKIVRRSRRQKQQTGKIIWLLQKISSKSPAFHPSLCLTLRPYTRPLPLTIAQTRGTPVILQVIQPLLLLTREEEHKRRTKDHFLFLFYSQITQYMP